MGGRGVGFVELTKKKKQMWIFATVEFIKHSLKANVENFLSEHF